LTLAASTTEVLERHLAAQWGRRLRAIEWAEGRRDELPPQFSVSVHRPRVGTLAYVTVGMSEGDAEGLEVFLLVRESSDDRAIAELLYATAHYHRTASRLGVAHTINFGRPWLPESACAHALVSLPYLDGPALERPADTTARILWLVPITPSELQFKKAYGADALEERLEAAGFDYLDPHRAPVV
jgi:hypothetical protein